MSYQTARDGIATQLKALGYHEAPFSAVDAPALQAAHKGFNIRVEEWAVENMMHNVVHAQPTFVIALWWVAKQDQQKDYDLAAASVESIMAKMLNPTNYASGVRVHRWQAGAIEYDAEKQIYQVAVSIQAEYNISLS